MDLNLSDIEARILGRLMNGEAWLRKDIHDVLEASLDPGSFQATLDKLLERTLLEAVKDQESPDTTVRRHPAFKITPRGLVALFLYESASTVPPRQP